MFWFSRPSLVYEPYFDFLEFTINIPKLSYESLSSICEFEREMRVGS